MNSNVPGIQREMFPEVVFFQEKFPLVRD